MEDPNYNEADVAMQIAKHLGTEHTELYITEKDAKEVIPRLSYIYSDLCRQLPDSHIFSQQDDIHIMQAVWCFDVVAN